MAIPTLQYDGLARERLLCIVPTMRIFLFILLYSCVCSAQPAKTQSVVMSDIQVAEKLRLYQKISSLRSHFRQLKKLNDLGVEIQSEGELSIERPNKVTWRVLKPAPTLLVLNGDAVLMESGSGKEKKQTRLNLSDRQLDPAVSRSLLSMVAWLRIDVPTIQKAYSMTQLGEFSFRCDPKEVESALFKSLSFYLHAKGHLEKLVIDEKSGDSIEIQFSTPTIKLAP